MSEIETQTKRKEEVKQLLLNEARLALDFNEKGILFNAEDIKRFRATDADVNGFRRNAGGVGFSLPHGISTNAKYNRWTPFHRSPVELPRRTILRHR